MSHHNTVGGFLHGHNHDVGEFTHNIRANHLWHVVHSGSVHARPGAHVHVRGDCMCSIVLEVSTIISGIV